MLANVATIFILIRGAIQYLPMYLLTEQPYAHHCNILIRACCQIKTFYSVTSQDCLFFKSSHQFLHMHIFLGTLEEGQRLMGNIPQVKASKWGQHLKTRREGNKPTESEKNNFLTDNTTLITCRIGQDTGCLLVAKSKGNRRQSREQAVPFWTTVLYLFPKAWRREEGTGQEEE